MNGGKEDSRRGQVIEFLIEFFGEEKYWAGGKIPPKKIVNEINISLLLNNVSIVTSLDVAYKALEKQKPERYKNISKKKWECRLCYSILRKCEKKIPKEHAGGMMLVYLMLCQGIDMTDGLRYINELIAKSDGTMI